MQLQEYNSHIFIVTNTNYPLFQDMTSTFIRNNNRFQIVFILWSFVVFIENKYNRTQAIYQIPQKQSPQIMNVFL